MGRFLPHWTKEGATYAVTFRLADALPAKAAERYRFERQEIILRAQHQGRQLTVIENRELARLYSTRIESLLDAGSGSCFLRQSAVAEIVQSALKHFDGERYDMLAWCIMPNHVHAVLRPLGEHKLEDILHSWKSFSAKKANTVLGRQGAFWQEEYYDHLVRDEEDFNHCVNYVLQNPGRANLANWPYVGMRPRQREPSSI
jgi:REP element-mobilizing transposase RayT